MCPPAAAGSVGRGDRRPAAEPASGRGAAHGGAVAGLRAAGGRAHL